MKSIITYLCVVVVCCTSCKKDFIYLAPEDALSGATFFKDANEMNQAVLATYNALRGLTNIDFYTSEMRSDNTHYENYTVNRGDSYVYREHIADFVNDAYNTYTASVYFACYTGISRANVVIERIQPLDIADSTKNDIEAQAKFLRAFFYFKLVRYFGGVPLYLKEVKKAEEAFLKRSSVDEVYQQIISDATFALETLKPPAKFPQSGLATKGSAAMLLAEVYMTQKKYADAENLLRTLPTMGYQLLTNYEDVFSTTNKNNRESIFEVQYMQGATEGQQSNFIYLFLPRSTNTTIMTGVQTNTTSSGGYNVPTKNIINAYEPGDKRLDASIGIAEGSYNSSMLFTFSAKKSILNYVPATGKVGVPFIKKYLHAHSIANNTDDNWIIYRYAGALLLLAETLNEQGKSSEALTYLNQVRVPRTGLMPITETDKEKLRDVIAHERRMELAFENHRWHDLVRTGKAVDVMTSFGIALKQQLSYIPSNAFNVTENKLIYPIPQAERNVYPELTQNPGY